VRLVDRWAAGAGIHAGTPHSRILLALLARVGGAEVPARWALAPSSHERPGFTLLHHAVLAKNFELTTRLLALGADPGEPAAGCGLTALLAMGGKVILHSRAALFVLYGESLMNSR
jgi:hypothetical protein